MDIKQVIIFTMVVCFALLLFCVYKNLTYYKNCASNGWQGRCEQQREYMQQFNQSFPCDDSWLASYCDDQTRQHWMENLFW